MKHINLKKITFYIINLKEDEERREFMEQQMKDLDLKYRMVPGVRVKPGSIGIALSHQKILKLKGLQVPFAILEDDCQFFYDRFKPILPIPDNVDSVYLGHSTFGVKPPDQYGLQWGKDMKAEYKIYDEQYIQILSMLARHCIIYVSEKFRQAAIEANFNALLNNDFPHPGDMAYVQIQKDHLILAPKNPWCYQSEKHFGNHNATKHALVDIILPKNNYEYKTVEQQFPHYRKSFYVYKEEGILYFQDNGGSGGRNKISIQQITEANEKYNFPDFPLTFVYTDCYSDQPKVEEVRSVTNNPNLRFLSYSGTNKIRLDQLIPDSYFSKYPELGVVNYTNFINDLSLAGQVASRNSKIGWNGTVKNISVTDAKIDPRAVLVELGQKHSDIIEANPVKFTNNHSTCEGFLALPEQIGKWKYLIDIESYGYSARIKFLLFSRRVLFIQERPWHEWYFRQLEPFVHYIPVKRDLSDLISQYKWIEQHPDKYKEIAANAFQFALENLTRERALNRWNEVLGKSKLNGIKQEENKSFEPVTVNSEEIVTAKSINKLQVVKNGQSTLIKPIFTADSTIFSENIMGAYFLKQFQKSNAKHNKYFVFHLGARGYFAEITSVARAAIYAHQHQAQLVLVNDDFGFKYERGWEDYFMPFCKEYNATTMEKDVAFYCKATKPGLFMRELTAHMPEELNFGPYTIHGFQEILRFFIQMLSRPNTEIKQLINENLQRLGILDRAFAAIHIRRGDKVGWEDTFYPVDVYLDYLEKMGGDDLPLFIMSDDYKAVEEIKQALAKRNSRIQLKTLCQSENTGFDVWALRKKQLAYRHDNPEETIEKQAFLTDTHENACTLMVETYIAATAKVFIGTRRSNVSYMIKALHSNPQNCYLLKKEHLKRK